MTDEYVEILYNKAYGGYGLSPRALELYNQRSGLPPVLYDDAIDRADPLLIQIFRELGEECNSRHCKLAICKIPIKYKDSYIINEYDGRESISIDTQDYIIYNIRKIVADDADPDAEKKITQIKEILSEFYPAAAAAAAVIRN